MLYPKIMRDLREDADKTQAEIAAVLHTSQTMYARYERGANALPIHHLMTLCDYFQVSTDAFLGRIPLPKRKEHETPQPHITLPVTENRV